VVTTSGWSAPRSPLLVAASNHTRRCAKIRVRASTAAKIDKTQIASGTNETLKNFLMKIASVLQLWKLPLLPFITSGEQLSALVRFFAMVGITSKKTSRTFDGLYKNYNQAVSGHAEGVSQAEVLRVMKQILSRVFKEFVEPYEFPSYHARMLSPYNYYEFGQTYVRYMVNFKNSYIGHYERFQEISNKLKRGENVILLANHQTEADPGVFALLLEKNFPEMAENVVYVAGDRVVTDPLAKPFSMGRNLLCVHSKKYIDEDPAKKPAKMKQNRATLVKMQKMLNEGGHLLWIAPSGGRDRPDDNGNWHPAGFDGTTVELMRRLASSAKSPTALYPFAMWSWKVMPPPPKVVVELGEERICNFTGTGIALSEQLDVEAITKGIDPEDKEAVSEAVNQFTWNAVNEEYTKLDEVITQNIQHEGYQLV